MLRDDDGKIQVGGRSGTQSLADPRVYLVGYGDWVGAASATLIGVGRTARATAWMIVDDLSGSTGPTGPIESTGRAPSTRS